MNEPALETIKRNLDDANVTLAENLPFIIKGTNPNKVGILLVHGFTGSPWEMREIGLALAKENAGALGIRLPGHGTSAEDLSDKKYEEWLAAVTEGYNDLAKEHDRIIGVGLSTGSLLLLAAAKEHHFTGLVLLSPYLKLRQILAPLAFLFKHFIKYSQRPADLKMSPYYYRERPIASIHQIYRLIHKVKRILPGMQVPTLVASAAGDITVNSESAMTLYNRLGSSRKEFYRFGKEVPHVLTTADNPKLDDVLRITSGFTGAIIEN